MTDRTVIDAELAALKRSSTVKSVRATLDNASNGGGGGTDGVSAVLDATNFDDFYTRQREFKVGEKQRRGEAMEILKSYGTQQLVSPTSSSAQQQQQQQQQQPDAQRSLPPGTASWADDGGEATLASCGTVARQVERFNDACDDDGQDAGLTAGGASTEIAPADSTEIPKPMDAAPLAVLVSASGVSDSTEATAEATEEEEAVVTINDEETAGDDFVLLEGGIDEGGTAYEYTGVALEATTTSGANSGAAVVSASEAKAEDESAKVVPSDDAPIKELEKIALAEELIFEDTDVSSEEKADPEVLNECAKQQSCHAVAKAGAAFIEEAVGTPTEATQGTIIEEEIPAEESTEGVVVVNCTTEAVSGGDAAESIIEADDTIETQVEDKDVLPETDAKVESIDATSAEEGEDLVPAANVEAQAESEGLISGCCAPLISGQTQTGAADELSIPRVLTSPEGGNRQKRGETTEMLNAHQALAPSTASAEKQPDAQCAPSEETSVSGTTAALQVKKINNDYNDRDTELIDLLEAPADSIGMPTPMDGVLAVPVPANGVSDSTEATAEATEEEDALVTTGEDTAGDDSSGADEGGTGVAPDATTSEVASGVAVVSASEAEAESAELVPPDEGPSNETNEAALAEELIIEDVADVSSLENPEVLNEYAKLQAPAVVLPEATIPEETAETPTEATQGTITEEGNPTEESTERVVVVKCTTKTARGGEATEGIIEADDTADATITPESQVEAKEVLVETILEPDAEVDPVDKTRGKEGEDLAAAAEAGAQTKIEHFSSDGRALAPSIISAQNGADVASTSTEDSAPGAVTPLINDDRQKIGEATDALNAYGKLVPSTSFQKRADAQMCAPSAMSTEEASKSDAVASPVDFKNVDYRGFIFVVHEQHGLMLLHCTRKRKKGPHFQLPGGHIDDFEFVGAARTCGGDPKLQLLAAAKTGAARELWEETGLDVRNNLDRLKPAALKATDSGTELSCELKKRLYFFLSVDDTDFLTERTTEEKLVGPMGTAGRNLKLKFSVEHSGFTFEKDPAKSSELLKKHSGGVGSQALRMSMSRDAHKGGKAKSPPKVGQPSPAVDVETTTSDAETGGGDRVVVGKTERYLDRSGPDEPIDLLPRKKASNKEGACCFPCFG